MNLADVAFILRQEDQYSYYFFGLVADNLIEALKY